MKKVGPFTAILLLSSIATSLISMLWLVSVIALDAIVGIRLQTGVFVLPVILLMAVMCVFILPFEGRSPVRSRVMPFADSTPLNRSIFDLRSPVTFSETSRSEPSVEMAPNKSKTSRTTLKSVLVVHRQAAYSEAKRVVAA